MISQIKLAFKALKESFIIIASTRLKIVLIFPFLVYGILVFASFYFSSELSNFLLDQIQYYISDIQFFNSNYTWLNSVLWWFFLVVSKLLVFLIYYQISTFIVLVLLSPVFAYVSEQTMAIKTGISKPFILKAFIADIFRGILVTTRNSFIQLVISVLCFMLAFVPLIGFLAVFVSVIVSFYYQGYSFMDYAYEQNRMSITESRRAARKNKFTILGFGGLFYLFSIIPFFGGIFSTISALFMASAATIYTLNNEV